MKYKPLLTILFLLICIFQATVTQEMSWEQEQVHVREVFAIAKRILPDCYELRKGTPESMLLDEFCTSISENMINKTKIAKANEYMKRCVNYVCEDDSLGGSRCKLMKKMKPKMELLNKEAMRLTTYWYYKADGETEMGREVAQAEKAYVMQMQYFPSLCDQLEPNIAEQIALAEFCETTKQNAVDKIKIKLAKEVLQALTSSICGKNVSDSVKKSPRCELVNRMKLRMEQLNKLVTSLNGHRQYKFDPSTVIPEPQEKEQQQSPQTHGQLILLIISALVIVVPLTVAFFCAIQLFLVFR